MGELIEVFKWFRGINTGDRDKIFMVSKQVRTRSNGFKLKKCRFNKEIGRNWFVNRVVDWNKLG